jgi:hypothetical protein
LDSGALTKCHSGVNQVQDNASIAKSLAKIRVFEGEKDEKPCMN